MLRNKQKFLKRIKLQKCKHYQQQDVQNNDGIIKRHQFKSRMN